MKKSSLFVMIIISLFVITGCGISSNSNSNIEDAGTVSAKEFYDNMDNDFYKQYINKKITITDLTADGPDFIAYKVLFVAVCNNQNSLPSDLTGNVSVSGKVTDSTMQSGHYLYLDDCVIK